jgi:hypothetical protein
MSFYVIFSLSVFPPHTARCVTQHFVLITTVYHSLHYPCTWCHVNTWALTVLLACSHTQWLMWQLATFPLLNGLSAVTAVIWVAMLLLPNQQSPYLPNQQSPYLPGQQSPFLPTQQSPSHPVSSHHTSPVSSHHTSPISNHHISRSAVPISPYTALPIPPQSAVPISPYTAVPHHIPSPDPFSSKPYLCRFAPGCCAGSPALLPRIWHVNFGPWKTGPWLQDCDATKIRAQIFL